ncbi:GTP 3',8-cyclase MoaA [Spirochaetia bacterium]|nr:GTP 3',8-cyclase MoaA [Spirochaetia bacterium]
MKDSFGRAIDYLRLSITDRCNLRCIYCMPPEGVDWMPHNDVIRFEEIIRICRLMAAMGIRKIKITGGEPLVRRGAAYLVRSVKALPGIEKVTMTTNGVLLGEYIDALIDAGLDSVNISLDSISEDNFNRITRKENLAQILSAINRTCDLGLPIKINCVPLKGVNEGDIAKLAVLAKNGNMAVRFIELMPLGAAAALRPIPVDEVMSLLEKEYGSLSPAAVKPGNGPAAYYTLPGFKGYIGFISALSHGFCESCNRLRLTAAGFLKPCLSSDMYLDLRALLRGGVSDSEIEKAIAELVSRKPACHSFGGVQGRLNHSQKEMFRIGG